MSHATRLFVRICSAFFMMISLGSLTLTSALSAPTSLPLSTSLAQTTLNDVQVSASETHIQAGDTTIVTVMASITVDEDGATVSVNRPYGEDATMPLYIDRDQETCSEGCYYKSLEAPPSWDFYDGAGTYDIWASFVLVANQNELYPGEFVLHPSVQVMPTGGEIFQEQAPISITVGDSGTDEPDTVAQIIAILVRILQDILAGM